MILLVWNTLATWQLLAPEVSSRKNPPIEPISALGPLPVDPAKEIVDNPRNRNLTVYQKYLIGKRIDINTALKDEIKSLPGISEAMAAAVVAERERIGGFRSPEDLLRVKGIKEKRLKKILPFLVKMENN
jgi:competence ComEA-like helix-hairpin-helix protein